MSCDVCGAFAVEPCQPWCSARPENFAAWKEARTRLGRLASNLATAAFGQAMFNLGQRFGRAGAALDEGYLDDETYAESWHPGCGKPWRGGE